MLGRAGAPVPAIVGEEDAVLHLIPDGDVSAHVLDRTCPCGPELVEVDVDGDLRTALQHNGPAEVAGS